MRAPLSSPPVEAAFFDLDKTVIAKASVVAFGTPLYKEGLISRRTVLRGLWGQLVYLHLGADEARIARMRTSVLALTKGWDQVRVRAIVEEALESVVEPIVFAEALELLRAHRAAGRLVVIVSASPEEIVLPLAGYLGVDEVVASRAMVDDEGRYTGRMAFDAFGPAKVDAIRDLAARNGIDLQASYAYSDSATDIPMLETVGHPVAVNPDRELARVAAEVTPSVVHIESKFQTSDQRLVEETGSGVIVTCPTVAGYYIVTNRHVIGDTATLEQVSIRLRDGRSFHPTQMFGAIKVVP